jgi:hypothetical protein
VCSLPQIRAAREDQGQPMTWFKVCDTLHSHPKTEKAGHEAMGLWVIAGSWSSDQLTDGLITEERCVRLIGDRKTAHRLAKSLVAAGFWVEVEGGYRYHDWHELQPTAESVKAEKARKRRNVADHRARRSQEVTAPVTGYSTGKTPVLFRGPDPDPDPDPIEEKRESAPSAAFVPKAIEVEPKAKAVRGTRCPNSVSERAATWCAAEGLPPPTGEVARMMDHFAALPGSKGTKLDWAATWRNWSTSPYGKSGGMNGMRTRQQLGLQGADAGGEY